MTDDTQAAWLLREKLRAPVNVVQWFAKARVPLEVTVEGYAFSWGQVAERVHPGLIYWDFYINRLLERLVECKRTGTGIAEVREAAFAHLDRFVDCIAVDAVVVVGSFVDLHGWRLLPNSNGALFSVVCHWLEERQCRDWLVTEFLPDLLPQAIVAAWSPLDTGGRTAE